MNYIFRLPRFPVILDSGERLLPAKSKVQLERSIEKLGIKDERKRDIIDANGEGFSYYPKDEMIAPSIEIRRWKKLQILDLYDSRRPQGSPIMKRTSLGNRRLENIVLEAVELLLQNHFEN